MTSPERQKHVPGLLVHVHVEVASYRPTAVHVGREYRMQDPDHLRKTQDKKEACDEIENDDRSVLFGLERV